MCQYCDYQDVIDEIDEMLFDDSYIFASDTLEGIRSWVENNSHVTDSQINAVKNIRESIHRRD